MVLTWSATFVMVAITNLAGMTSVANSMHLSRAAPRNLSCSWQALTKITSSILELE